ncbi:N-acetylmuramoyl-L-alanine amidase [Paenibacillus sediminis]|uniref:N-acetylmuramoyl-L-alanine amidase n=1 Tax=Paenibacillus sediminis TaxID=664909 RepID=A0ABS4H0E5_9BACL|nr:N-acetylmuramoyl-L-alanine amidase [Paenibacillus sediminis]MBP1935832.1 N-acetylmuramoyl-L-alanine amidase [Paenibacillus sediminis]
MKKFGILMFLVVFMMAFPNAGSAAQVKTSIVLDGQTLTLPQGVEVENVNGNVMIPIRVVVEQLGFNVLWDQKTRTVTIKDASKEIKLVVGQQTATVNGTSVRLNASPIIRGTGTVIIPLRFVSEQMGLIVGWDNNTKTVYLTSPKVAVPPTGGNTGAGSDVGSTVPNDNLALVNGVSFEDNQLMIAVSGSVKPNVFKMSGPDRIVVDLPGSKYSDTFLANQSVSETFSGELAVTGYPQVSKVRYAKFSDNPPTIRFVIDLNSPSNYTVTGGDGNSSLIVVDLNGEAANPAPDNHNGKKIVVIDAGHGAKDPGAIGINNMQEKVQNLALALKVQNLLKNDPNISVVLTRSDDTFLELSERVKIAEDLKADIFISIHANSSTSPTASGVETYYQRSESIPLAKVMHKYLVSSSGLKDRGVAYGNFHVIRETTMPAVLLEAGYISNAGDEAKMFTDSFRNNVAGGIVAGIKEYLGVK